MIRALVADGVLQKNTGVSVLGARSDCSCDERKMNMSLGSRIWLNSDLEAAEISEWPIGQVASYSRRCPGKATGNEDGALIVAVDQTRTVLAVADGCGGMNAGADAAKITLETLKRFVLRGKSHGGSLRAEILDGIEATRQINEQLVISN